MLRGLALISLLIGAVATTAAVRGDFELLHSFTRGLREPIGDLCEGEQGEFFGMARRGGAHDLGGIFKVAPDGTLTQLHAFAGNEASFSFLPNAGLIRGADGSFYGIADAGGAYHYGAFFRVTPTGEFTTLHHFLEARQPTGALALGADGNFYGFTARVGDQDAGALYKMAPSGVLTVLHTFEGSLLEGALTLASDGAFYGGVWLSSSGPEIRDQIVKVSATGEVTVLHRFIGSYNDPQWPAGRLVEASDGNLYGVVRRAGADFAGALYLISKSGHFEIVHTFTAAEGSNPTALVRGADDLLYGLFTPQFTDSPPSTLFQASLSGEVTVLHRFKGGEEGHTVAGLIRGRDGQLYGATSDGGTAKRGTVFRSTAEGSITPLVAFVDDGVEPRALVRAPDDFLYGFTAEGGMFGRGVFFRISALGEFSVISHLDDQMGSLLVSRDGVLYGTSARFGSFFRIAPNGERTVLYRPEFEHSGVSHLIEGEPGIFFGLLGDSIVRLTQSGDLFTLKTFQGGSGGVTAVRGPLAIGLDGAIYGNDARAGGFFRLTSGGDFRYVHSYPARVYSGLVRGFDGAFYGAEGQRLFRITAGGEFAKVGPAGRDLNFAVLAAVGNRIFTGDYEAVERITLPAGERAPAHVFAGDGSLVSALTNGGDGFLYIATRFGGEGGGGAIGRVPVEPRVPVAGVYGGFFENANITTWGTLRVRLTATGQVTGVLWFQGGRFSIRTTMSATREAFLEIPRAGQESLTLHLSFDGDTLGGTLTAGRTVFSIATSRAPWNAERTAPQAGQYTVALSPFRSPHATVPQGSGYALMRVKRGGQVTLAGRLATGAAFSAGSVLSADGTFPLTIGTAAGTGEGLAGTVSFRETTSVSDCDGALRWRRDPQPGATRYPRGFYTDAQLVGSRYVPPIAPARVLTLGTAGDAIVRLSMAGPPEPGMDLPIRISPTHDVTVQPPLLSIKIDAGNGLFSGRLARENESVQPIRGIFLQKQNRGAGFSLSPTRSGAVSITASE